MTNDTLKSMSMLKKSLKMNRRASENNQAKDGTTDLEVTDRKTKIDILLADIEAWEKKATVAQSVPTGVIQPAPAASTVSTVSTATTATTATIVSNPDGSDNDLLTV